jgi:16S rRNA (uracil1498-N3)-methyltransferase
MPLVSDPVELGEAAELLGGYGRTLVLWEDADRSRLLLPALQDIADGQAASLALFVGPEGGLTAEEVAVLVAAGGVPVSFGPSVLRTETAAVVALGMAVAVGYGMIADDVR